MPPIVLTLLSKPGCHLCDDAREVVAEVVAALGDRVRAPVTVDEVSILDDPDLLEKYSEEIPVLLINGRVHNIWRIEPARLRAALVEEDLC
ncbi:MAG: glutaredoxin family protein [Microbacteriaceae bacterium]|nr:glutaredoxin family protein [Microbacteriaceae bacterium]